jgi:hypothetical protein
MLLKVVFDKTVFVKFKISNNKKTLMKHVQNTKNLSKNPYHPIDFKNLRKKSKEPKISRLVLNVCDFQKENHTLGYGFKNL